MDTTQIVQLAISTVIMALIVIAAATLVLNVRPVPIWQALLIAVVANVLGKLFVSCLHWPSAASYGLPTTMAHVLSFVFFRPTIPMFLAYWLFGFALYLIIHTGLSVAFGWTFMFPFWDPRPLLGSLH